MPGKKIVQRQPALWLKRCEGPNDWMVHASCPVYICEKLRCRLLHRCLVTLQICSLRINVIYKWKIIVKVEGKADVILRLTGRIALRKELLNRCSCYALEQYALASQILMRLHYCFLWSSVLKACCTSQKGVIYKHNLKWTLRVVVYTCVIKVNTDIVRGKMSTYQKSCYELLACPAVRLRLMCLKFICSCWKQCWSNRQVTSLRKCGRWLAAKEIWL